MLTEKLAQDIASVAASKLNNVKTAGLSHGQIAALLGATGLGLGGIATAYQPESLVGPLPGTIQGPSVPHEPADDYDFAAHLLDTMEAKKPWEAAQPNYDNGYMGGWVPKTPPSFMQ